MNSCLSHTVNIMPRSVVLNVSSRRLGDSWHTHTNTRQMSTGLTKLTGPPCLKSKYSTSVRLFIEIKPETESKT